MDSAALLPLSNTREVAKFLAKRAMRGQGFRRVKEAAGIGESISNMGSQISDMGSKAVNWVTDPAHLNTRLPMVGAGVGGLTGLLSSYNRPEEERQPFRSALTGAIAGGAVGLGGAAAKGLYDRYSSGPTDVPGLDKAQKAVGDLEDLPGQVAEEQGAFMAPGVFGAAGLGYSAADTALTGRATAARRAQRSALGKKPKWTPTAAETRRLKQIEAEGAQFASRRVQGPFGFRADDSIGPRGILGGRARAASPILAAKLRGLKRWFPRTRGLIAPAALMAASYALGSGRNQDLVVEKAKELVGGQ